MIQRLFRAKQINPPDYVFGFENRQIIRVDEKSTIYNWQTTVGSVKTLNMRTLKEKTQIRVSSRKVNNLLV
jgi:hypothetical protein